MMVETMLESSQDFGMSSPVAATSLPQWKRELLQRRAARSRPPAAPAPATPPPAPSHPPPPPPPPASAPDDEELRYGPGIVKRLKSRYLSLALRDAPRRRPSVLRRAASLEHLLEPAPPAPAPAPATPPRPAARAPRPAPAAPARRDFVKRARSVDALSRLESRDEPPPPSLPPSAPPPPPPPGPQPASPAPLPPRPASARPPRRPAPLLRDAERPPPDLVRSTLRKFEPAPVRRAAPAARVSAALRGLERATTPTPEPRSPSPVRVSPGGEDGDELRPADEAEGPASSTPRAVRAVSRAALEGIARAGSSTRYAFPTGTRPGAHLPPLAATNPVLLGRARRVGVIRPMPASPKPAPAPRDRAAPATSPHSPLDDIIDKMEESPRLPAVEEAPPAPTSPPTPPPPPASPRAARGPPPSALVEPTPRTPPAEAPPPPPPLPRSPPPAPYNRTPDPSPIAKPEPSPKPKLLNGHATPPRSPEMKHKVSNARFETKLKEHARTEATETELPWNGVTLKKTPVITECRSNGSPLLKTKNAVNAESLTNGSPLGAGAGRARGGGGARGGTPPSVVFNFSHRKDVPDYIENDGLILRAARTRHRIKAGEPGVVILNPELVGADGGDSEGEGETEDGGRPPSPCSVRFVNDNVLINGRSSMPPRPTRDKDRIARLKLQFDDSLTRTFEYPSETSLCEDGAGESDDPAPLVALATLVTPVTPAPADTPVSTLAANTHISSAALGRYTPHKTCADAFQLGVTRHVPIPTASTTATASASPKHTGPSTGQGEGESAGEGGTQPQADGGAKGGEAAAGGGASAGAGGGGDARPCGADARSWSDARALATDLLF